MVMIVRSYCIIILSSLSYIISIVLSIFPSGYVNSKLADEWLLHDYSYGVSAQHHHHHMTRSSGIDVSGSTSSSSRSSSCSSSGSSRLLLYGQVGNSHDVYDDNDDGGDDNDDVNIRLLTDHISSSPSSPQLISSSSSSSSLVDDTCIYPDYSRFWTISSIQFWSVVDVIYIPIQYIFTWLIPPLHLKDPSLSSLSSSPSSFDENPMPAQSSLSPSKTTSSLPSQSPSSLPSSSNHYHKVSLLRAITIFIISIFYVGFLSTSIVTFSELIISSLGINASTLGATIVALGMTVLLLFHK